MNLSTEKKIMDLQNRLVVAKWEGEWVEWIGSLGLIDADYCLWNRLAMRSCCAALGTTSGHLWWSMIMWEKRMYTCMSNWVTMLYSRKKMYWRNNNWLQLKKEQLNLKLKMKWRQILYLYILKAFCLFKPGFFI